MLNRLQHLQQAARKAPVSGDARVRELAELEKVDTGETAEQAPGEQPSQPAEEKLQDWKPPPQVKKTDVHLEEYLEFLDQMHELFREILGFEGMTRQALDEVSHNVDIMEDIIRQEREALLPTTILELVNRFESHELVCQRMINRAKDALDILKNREAELILEPVQRQGVCAWLCPEKERLAHAVPEMLGPVRASIAAARAAEYKRLVLRFFALRSANKQDQVERTTRQLKYAFPEALDSQVEHLMEFPEFGLGAVQDRLEKGDEVSLEKFIMAKESDPERENQKRLVQGAKELKLMILQFSELIDTQGEALDSIEANVKQVLEQTSTAIETLTDAVEQKKEHERMVRKAKRVACYCCVFIVLVIIVNIVSFYTNFQQMIHPFSSSYLQLSSIDESQRMKKPEFLPPNKHRFQVRPVYRSASRVRIKSHAAERNPALPGFIAPHEPGAANATVLQSVALTARGSGATLRKRTAAGKLHDVAEKSKRRPKHNKAFRGRGRVQHKL